MRPLLVLTLLLTCLGCSIEEQSDDAPFKIKGFYPGMTEADFAAVAESHGTIDLRADDGTARRMQAEMSDFTIGGVAVSSVVWQQHSSTDYLITFNLRTTDTEQYQSSLAEVLALTFGKPSKTASEERAAWNTFSYGFDYIYSLTLTDGVVELRRGYLGPSVFEHAEQEQRIERERLISLHRKAKDL